MFYILSGIQLKTQIKIPSFADFEGEEKNLPTIELSCSREPFLKDVAPKTFRHKDMDISVLENGWLYTLVADRNYQLFVSLNYKKLVAYITSPQIHHSKLQPLLRTAIECASAFEGVISLHSACVETGGKAVCFTASSGVGKSTRAQKWLELGSAQMISGDRPQIKITPSGVFACGVPWDGKEKIYKSISAPLLSINRVIRSDTTKIKKLTFSQARRIITGQCFIPMWDTEAAVRVMALITNLCQSVPIYNLFCGQDITAAQETKNILFNNPEDILMEEKDMKIKSGYVLRDVAGQFIVMPTGDNISDFGGTVILNELSAFVWKKLEKSVSRDELLLEITNEYDIDTPTAEKDLDELLKKFYDYGVIEEI